MHHDENTAAGIQLSGICERTEENGEGGGRGSLFMQQNWHREQAMSARESEISTEPVTDIQLLLFAAGYTGIWLTNLFNSFVSCQNLHSEQQVFRCRTNTLIKCDEKDKWGRTAAVVGLIPAQTCINSGWLEILENKQLLFCGRGFLSLGSTGIYFILTKTYHSLMILHKLDLEFYSRASKKLVV